MGLEALPEFWDGLGGNPEGLRQVGKPSRRYGTSREAFHEVLETLPTPPGGPEWMRGPPEGSGRV